MILTLTAWRQQLSAGEPTKDESHSDILQTVEILITSLSKCSLHSNNASLCFSYEEVYLKKLYLKVVISECSGQ